MSWERYNPSVDLIVRRPPCNVVDDCDTPAAWVLPQPGSDRYACTQHLLERAALGATSVLQQ